MTHGGQSDAVCREEPDASVLFRANRTSLWACAVQESDAVFQRETSLVSVEAHHVHSVLFRIRHLTWTTKVKEQCVHTWMRCFLIDSVTAALSELQTRVVEMTACLPACLHHIRWKGSMVLFKERHVEMGGVATCSCRSGDREPAPDFSSCCFSFGIHFYDPSSSFYSF